MKAITQVYERHTSYMNDAERGDVLHRILYTARRKPSELELKHNQCTVSTEHGFTYYRLYPTN